MALRPGDRLATTGWEGYLPGARLDEGLGGVRAGVAGWHGAQRYANMGDAPSATKGVVARLIPALRMHPVEPTGPQPWQAALGHQLLRSASLQVCQMPRLESAC